MYRFKHSISKIYEKCVFQTYLSSGLYISGTTIHMYIINLLPQLSCGSFYERGQTLIPAWISNYFHCKIWDETKV